MTNQPAPMHYHTPDNIWRAFSGVTDFESYAEKFVVIGRFHRDVPPEVVEGYTIAEHIMAHAYYRYPAMDEALVKLLRVLEMAVKMRCGQLGIETGKKNLQKLIDLIFPKTTANEFNGTLHWLRGVRNFLMHPDRTSLLGSIALNHIQQCVIMLNALFLPDQYFQDARTELERIQGLCQQFENGLSVLEHTGHRYIIYRCEFVETYFAESEWLVLCAFHAVPVDFRSMLANGCYPAPLVYLVKGFQIKDGKISGTVTECGQPFVVTINDHPVNKATLEQFEQEKSEMDASQKMLFQVSANSGIGSERTKSRYMYWGGPC